MKKIIHGIGVVAIVAIAINLASCDPSLKDRVKNAVSDDDLIDADEYADLRDYYASKHEGDTIGFYEDLVEIIEEDLGYSGYKIEQPAQAVQAVKLPLAVSIYLDNSSSMQGYYKPRSNGNIVELTNLLAALQQAYNQPISAYYVQNKKTVAQDFDEMSKSITTKKLPFGDAYELDVFLTEIANAAQADSAHRNLSFFLTDGILSGTSQEIRSDRNFNLNNGPLLRNRIANALAPLAAQGYGAAIYKFDMPYDGTYYRFDNGTKAVKGVRPFYVIAIGPAADVASFSDKAIAKNTDFQPVDVMVMASPVAQKITPSVVNGQREGNSYEFEPNKDDVKKNSQGEFAVTDVIFTLADLPEYMRDEQAIRDGLKVTAAGDVVDPSAYKFSDGKVRVPVKVARYTSVPVIYEFNDCYPGWVSQVISNKDENIADEMDKTFNFDYLVRGFKQGIYGLKSNQLVPATTITIDWTDGEIED